MTQVLVVDDSALMRRLLAGVLTEAGFSVEVARNGAEGVERLVELKPDVVTLDVNMPEMDGLTALSLMMQARPTPVVMVSSLTSRGAQATFEALALGAVDFIAKPGGTISLSVEAIAAPLVAKVKAAQRARLSLSRTVRAPREERPEVVARTPEVVTSDENRRPGSRAESVRRILQAEASAGRRAVAQASAASAVGRPPGLVLIGVSTGGPRALETILPALPAGFPWPVLVAQHMPAHFTDAFAQRMNGLCALPVQECSQTLPLQNRHVYIARGGTDMVVVQRLGRLAVQPRDESPGHPWHPSVDVLVDSALRLMPPANLVGVLLTGMGDDGAAAMTRLRQGGGRTIAESEATAVVFGMPAELIERGGAGLVLPCDEVARQLCLWTSGKR